MRAQKAKLESLRAQLAELQARYNPNHPEVIRLKREIADLELNMVLKQQEQVRELTLAQTAGQIITGSVYDPMGAVMPGVKIRIIDPKTNEALLTTACDAKGSFEIQWPPQDFVLQFELPPFEPKIVARQELGSGPLSVIMELGQIRETVTVVTGAPQVPPSPRKVWPIRVGGNVHQPKLIQRSDPVYPPEARQENVEGTVVVSALIDEQGQVKDPIILSGHPLLNNAALEAVSQWRYSPGLMNGEYWPMRLLITLVFKLDR